MPALDELTTPEELGEMIRRVVKENKIELLHDEESDQAVALVPMQRLLELLEASEPKLRILRKHIQKLHREERERERQARELAEALTARETERMERQALPWESVKSDPTWQKRWDDLLHAVRGSIDPEVPPEELEADIRAACESIRQDRRASHS